VVARNPYPDGDRRYRGRFAPSPTGALHSGGARTALVGWLRARHEGGAFVMRVEDLDPPRVIPGAARQILDDLRWLGIDWDEGPDLGGPFAPYVQSERLSRYDAALERLRAGGAVYRCTCTRKEVQIASAPHGEADGDDGPRYPGTCRDGPTHPERPAALRFRMPDPMPGFDDVLHGPVPARESTGDFVVRRSDGLHAYQLAVVADDIAMEITEVVRGDDLLSSTPRQIALYRALGAEPPRFFHVPLVLGPDGARLGKRHGSIAIADRRAAGATPEQVVGDLAASLELVPRGTPIAAADLVASFDPSRLPRGATAL
jgi:glutamyl-tRNA synthetase